MTEPITEEYLLSLAAERQVNRTPQEYERCRLCNHGWHGLKCQSLGDHCDCPTARTA